MRVADRNALVDLDRLERLLLRAGAGRRTLTYGEVLRHFGRRVGPGNVARLCRDLAEVCRRVEARGGPDLACLVVRRDDGLPGAGYIASLLDRRGRTPTREALVRLVRRRQERAFVWCAAACSSGDPLPAEIDFLG